FFFFQAEDGIRDLIVTGVQTCALPIFPFEILPTDHDPNAGHFTAIASNDGVLTSYDLRPNARHAAEHGEAAREFLDSAAASLGRSEERRVGKEGRSRRGAGQWRENEGR